MGKEMPGQSGLNEINAGSNAINHGEARDAWPRSRNPIAMSGRTYDRSDVETLKARYGTLA